jgi:tRNA pseudouridine38-40 synthase
MDRAARALIGEHDFTSFRTVACQSPTPMRLVTQIGFSEHGNIVDIEFVANAFLHHMIRNLVGSLLLVGRGERPDAWIAEVLAARDRKRAGPTAPPQGLVFLGPRYPATFGLPAEHSR